MPNNVVIHTITAGDSAARINDLLNWLKLYNKYRDLHNSKLVLYAVDLNFLTNILVSLHLVEPEHPVFTFVTLERKGGYPLAVAKQNCRIISRVEVFDENTDTYQLQPPPVLHVAEEFALKSDDNISVVQLCSHNPRIVLPTDINIAHVNIFEMYSGINPRNNTWLSRKAPKDTANNYLGLTDGNLGLLVDTAIKPAASADDIHDILARISPVHRFTLFNETNPSYIHAIKYLRETPIVFGYLPHGKLRQLLLSILRSPLIQKAIADQKRPLFVLTSKIDISVWPKEFLKAMTDKKIKVISFAWLTHAEYRNIAALLLNQYTIAMLIASEDNTLSMACQTGKLPIDAFMATELPPGKVSKAEFFKDLLACMQQLNQGLDYSGNPGFADCAALFTALSQPVDRSTCRLNPCESVQQAEAKHMQSISENLTVNALNFFRDHLAPYVLSNYGMEISMPTVCAQLEAYTSARGLSNEAQTSTCLTWIMDFMQSASRSNVCKFVEQEPLQPPESIGNAAQEQLLGGSTPNQTRATHTA